MRLGWLTSCTLALVATVGCRSLGYSFTLREGSPSALLVSDRQIVDHVHRLAGDARNDFASHLAPLFHSEADPDLARRDRRIGSGNAEALVDEATCRSLQPVAGFVHLSDGQIKEASVDLEPPITRLIAAADRDDALELYGYGTFLATVLSVNELAGPQPGYAPCPAPLPPQFVIHTGDAIDAAMYSELYQFLAVVNELEIPFLNVVGNHDDLFFGTLPAAKMSGFNVVAPFVPVHGYQRFIRSHHPEASHTDISIPYSARDQHEATNFAEAPPHTTQDFPGSAFHGFDFVCSDPVQRELCKEAEGYYATSYHVRGMASGSEPLTVHLVVLNTFEWPPGSVIGALVRRSLGRMRETQFEWLRQELAGNAGGRTVTMVFGHHPFGSFANEDGDRLKSILTEAHNVVAYFAGHTHEHEVRRHARHAQEIPLWEVIGGANITYPQYGVHVELLEHVGDPTIGYIRLRSFEQRLSEAQADCTDLSNETSPLPCLARAGVEGATRDAGASAQEKRARAIAEANGMLRIVLRQ